MPLTAAEKQKKYRDKLKNENPQKYEEIQKKARERSAQYYERKKNTYTEANKQELRQKWKEDRRKANDAKIAAQNEPSISQFLNSKQYNKQSICRNEHRRIEYRLKQENAQFRSQLNTLCKSVQNIKKKLNRQKIKLDKMQQDYENLLIKLTTKNKTEKIHTRESEEDTPKKKVAEFINNTIPNVETPKKEIIRKKLFEHNVLTESLKSQFQTANNSEKNVLRRVLNDNIVKKYKQKTKITASLGFKSNFKMYRQKKTKTTTLQNKIECFFNRDDVSRATAGKKEYRTFKKVKRQKRYLLEKLNVLHRKFIAEEGLISFSTFKKYRPFYVLSPNTKDCESCACIKHSNIQFLVDELKSHNILKTDNLNEVTSDLVCNFNSRDCMYNNCIACSENKLKVDDEKMSDDASWFSWVLKEHEYEKQGEKKKIKKMIKIKKEGTVHDLLEVFSIEMKKFKTHIFNFYYQYKKYKECINNLEEYETCIHIDFSENFTCKYHQEVQAMHFIKEQITLHTGVIYIKGEKKPISFCSISPDNQHNPEAIWAHLHPVLQHIKINYPNICTIHFFSDGPTTQYRQKKNFFLFSKKLYEYGFSYGTWSFFEAAHGKGAADGIGGVIKRSLDSKIAHGKDIPNAETAFNALKSEATSIKLFYISSLDIKPLHTKLSPLSQTMKIHQLITTEPLKLKYRDLSCFCGDPRGSCECHSPLSHNFFNTNENKSNKQIKITKEKEVIRSKNSKKSRRRSITSSSEENDNVNIEYAESDATVGFISDDSMSFDFNDENNPIIELDEKTGILKQITDSNKVVTLLSPEFDVKMGILKQKNISNKKLTVLSEVIFKKAEAETNLKPKIKRKLFIENEELMKNKIRKTKELGTGKDDVTILSQVKNTPQNTASYDLRESNICKEEDTIIEIKRKDSDEIKIINRKSAGNTKNKNHTKEEMKKKIEKEEKDKIKYNKTDENNQITNDNRDEGIQDAVKCKENDQIDLSENNRTESIKEDESYNKESNMYKEGRKAIESKENEQNDFILYPNDSIIVRYYLRKTWKYFIGFIENIEFKDGENHYKVLFLKTVKDAFDSVKFVVPRKSDMDIVTTISIVKKINLIQREEASKVYYLTNDFDMCFFT